MKSMFLLAALAVFTCVGVPVLGQAPSGSQQPGTSQATASQTAAAATDQGPPPNMDPAGADTGGDSSGADNQESNTWAYLTSNEFILALLVLSFGVLVLGIASWTLRKTNVTAEQALRLYGVVVILVGTILLIVIGLSNNQIAPAVGLFGTLAGYLLGKTHSSEPAVGAAAHPAPPAHPPPVPAPVPVLGPAGTGTAPHPAAPSPSPVVSVPPTTPAGGKES